MKVCQYPYLLSTKIAAILDFTKSSNSPKNCQYFFVVRVVKYDAINYFAAFDCVL